MTEEERQKVRQARRRLFRTNPDDTQSVRAAQREYLDELFPKSRGKRAQLVMEMEMEETTV